MLKSIILPKPSNLSNKREDNNMKKIGIISPSMPLTSPIETAAAVERLKQHNIECKFFTQGDKIAEFEACQNSDVELVMASRGGFNSIELLPRLNFGSIKKPLCGYSDITVLLNAILSQTAKVQFLGPNLKALNTDIEDYAINNFIQTVWQEHPVEYEASERYVDTHVSKEKEYLNVGPEVINNGEAEGYLVGGNLCSQLMLCGTKYYPVYNNMILVAEEDDLCGEHTLDMFMRNLWALFNYSFAANIKGLIIGRFMHNSKVNKQELIAKLRKMEVLKSIPVIADFDTGHTLPQMTLPLGKKAVLSTVSKHKLKF